MELTDLTAIGRPIDPHYPTNRAIALLSLLVVAAGTVGQRLWGLAWAGSLSWGIGAGFSVFFAWALGRELDPDHDLSAFVAAGLMLIALLIFDLPSLLSLFWLLVALRIVNRTTGLPARIADSLLLLGLGGWLSWQGNWVFGLVTAVAFYLDGRLSAPLRRQWLFAGLALALIVLSLALYRRFHGGGGLSLPYLLSILGALPVFSLVNRACREVQAVCDVTGRPLNARRVRAAQYLALWTALQVAWYDGDPGVVSLLPLWAAMLGTGLYQLFLRGRRLARSRGKTAEV
jgi:hypothetical protein